MNGNLFRKGDKVAIGASGGKDSTVLAYILKLLNERHKYELELFLLSIDEGITGSYFLYDPSITCVILQTWYFKSKILQDIETTVLKLLNKIETITK